MTRTIVLYIYALAAGGAERVIATLATGLAERGHDVTLVTDVFSPDLAFLVSSRVRTVELGPSHIGATLRLARLLRERRPDVSLSATGVSNLKHAAASLLAGRARRAIMSFHGHIESEPGRLSWLGNALAPVLTRLLAPSVFVSDDLLAAFVARGAESARAVRIYNPVSLPSRTTPDSPAKNGIAPPVHTEGGGSSSRPASEDQAGGEIRPASRAHRPRRIVAVGRLVPLKGFDTLVRAVALMDDPTVSLTIVGEGPHRAALEAQIVDLGLTGRVALPGWAPDPSPFYAAADGFVLASTRESFGNVVVEALAHGLPVVATDCGGPREILGEGRFGRLVPVGDAAALARAIAEMLADPGPPGPRQARATAFGAEVAIDAYLRLFDRVAADTT